VHTAQVTTASVMVGGKRIGRIEAEGSGTLVYPPSMLRRETLGYFDIVAAAKRTLGGGSRRAIDPSGFVKGWAIEGAGRILAQAGVRNYSVNAGGDVCLSGSPPGLGGWRVGVQHPSERMAVAAVLELSRGAVATSGAYERGSHIVDPHTGQPPEGVLSVTITGSDLATVDAYATAAYAMGRRGAEWAARLQGHGAIVIFDDERIAYSQGVERHLRGVGPQAEIDGRMNDRDKQGVRAWRAA